MNAKIFLISMVLTYVALISAEDSNSNSSSNQSQPSLIEMFNLILNDPEFLALSEYNQIRIMEAIVEIVEHRIKQIQEFEQHQPTIKRAGLIPKHFEKFLEKDD